MTIDQLPTPRSAWVTCPDCGKTQYVLCCFPLPDEYALYCACGGLVNVCDPDEPVIVEKDHG